MTAYNPFASINESLWIIILESRLILDWIWTECGLNAEFWRMRNSTEYTFQPQESIKLVISDTTEMARMRGWSFDVYARSFPENRIMSLKHKRGRFQPETPNYINGPGASIHHEASTYSCNMRFVRGCKCHFCFQFSPSATCFVGYRRLRKTQTPPGPTTTGSLRWGFWNCCKTISICRTRFVKVHVVHPKRQCCWTTDAPIGALSGPFAYLISKYNTAIHPIGK